MASDILFLPVFMRAFLKGCYEEDIGAISELCPFQTQALTMKYNEKWELEMIRP